MNLDQIQDKICRRLKEIRLEKKMTQDDFDAEPEGISSRKIRLMESLTETNLELRTILKYCKLTNIHPQEIFNFDMPWAKKP